MQERLVAWRARFGLAIDNALNFLNNPDGIQGHNFGTQIVHVDDRRVLQGRLTHGPLQQRAAVLRRRRQRLYSLVADVLERLGPHSEVDTVDAETVARLKDAVALVERRAVPRERA